MKAKRLSVSKRGGVNKMARKIVKQNIRQKTEKVERVFNLKYHEDAEQYFDILAMMNAQKIKFGVRNNGALRVIEIPERYAHLFEQNQHIPNILKPAELMMPA